MTARDQLDSIWKLVCNQLRTSISPDAYNRWFSSLKLASANDDCVHVIVPDSIHQLWIEVNFLSTLKDAFGAATGVKPKFTFAVDPSQCVPVEMAEAEAAPVPAMNTLAAVEPLEVVQAAEAVEFSDAVELPAGEEGQTFENFVVGANNQFAHAAALAVAQKPGKSYNPLFLHGGSGLGKTHLMHAIGAEVRARRPRARVVYITSEEFTNLFINALQTHSIARFRKRFRQADVLLIDDVHFLAGKERSQEEFFHTFNALLDAHKQIVLCSDRPPAEIKDLEQRLVTRFEWGHTTELTPPDEETRVAILRKKAEVLQVDVPTDILEFLAQRISSNVRRLEGGLVRVSSWISLHEGMPLDLNTAEELLRDLLQQEAKNHLSVDRIQRAVAEAFDLRLADMVSRKRPNNIAQPRMIAMYLSRQMIDNISYAEIGKAFGGRDHGTAIHACRTVEERMKEEPALRQRVNLLENQLKRGR
jgi:chromosomal replication initiator protein